MFKDIYKAANDDIKADRDILDKIFSKKYVKKNSVFRNMRVCASAAIAIIVLVIAVKLGDDAIILTPTQNSLGLKSVEQVPVNESLKSDSPEVSSDLQTDMDRRVNLYINDVSFSESEMMIVDSIEKISVQRTEDMSLVMSYIENENYRKSNLCGMDAVILYDGTRYIAYIAKDGEGFILTAIDISMQELKDELIAIGS